MRRNQFVGAGLAILALAAVVGCRQTEEPVVTPPEPTTPIADPAPVSATYVCDSGLTVAVAYPDPQSAQVTYRDRTFVLRGAPAATGARFVNAEVEWRTVTPAQGVEQATLSRIVDGDAAVVLERCQRPAPAPVAPVAKAGEVAASPGAGPVSAPCKSPQLALSAEGGDAGTGNRVAIIGVQNIGTRACSLSGYPGVVVQDRQGRDLTTVRAEQSLGSYFRAGQVPAPVELKARAKAFFDLVWTVVPNETLGETVCPSAARVRMTAPGDTSAVSLDQEFTPCGRRIQVSPFRSVAEPTPAQG